MPAALPPSTVAAPRGGRPGTSVDPNRPDLTTDAYRRMAGRWQKCRDLMEGTTAIRRGAETYLPRFPTESQASYDARGQLAALFNGYERTVLASVGMLGVHEPMLGDDMPQELVGLWEDVDGKGTHGSVFSAALVQSAIVDGHAGIFVDMPALDAGPIDAASAKARGLRPYWILVSAPDEFLPFYETVNGRETLTLLIRRQVTSERVGRFGITAVTRYWIYSRTPAGVEYQRFDRTEDAPTPTLAEGPALMRHCPEIPYARLVAGTVIDGTETKPTLETLADLNIEHHQTKTGVLHLEQKAMVPSIVRVGAKPDTNGVYPPVTLGPESTIEAPYLQGVSTPIYWLSPDVSVLAPAMQTLASTEAAMEASGSAFLAPTNRIQETAAAKKINAKAQNATLARVGRALQDALEFAFGFSATYLGLQGGSVTVNTDFEDLTLDAATMTAYVTAVAQAGMPIRILLQAWQKGGRIAADVDLDELEDELMANQEAIAAEKQQEADDLEAERRAALLKASGGEPAVPVDGQVGVGVAKEAA